MELRADVKSDEEGGVNYRCSDVWISNVGMKIITFVF